MIRYFLTGVLMGICDLIPGISGGTIAYLLGVYEELIDHLSSFGVNLLEKERGKGHPLFFTLMGMGTSLLIFSHAVHYLLLFYREPLLASFCGLILSSTFLHMKEIKKIKPMLFVLGFCLAFFLPEAGAQKTILSPLTLVVAGYFSISAMLLPGISGSYVLHLFGAYEEAIKALVTLGITPLKSISFLSFLLIGILGGGLTFTKVIHYLLKKHENVTLSLLSGFMLGSIKMILPKTVSLTLFFPFFLGALLVFILKSPLLKKGIFLTDES
jgi:putative membrane protein